MASGNSLLSFEAAAFFPPLANYATFLTRNTHGILQFDAATAESAYCAGFLPRHYSGGGITARVMWTAATAVSGTVTWQIAIERHDPTTDLDADSFAAAVSSAAATTNAVSGAPTYTDVALTNAQIDGLLAGEHFRLKITRATGGIAGDAELWAVELRET